MIVEADLETAEAKLLATDGLRKFHQGLKTTKEKDDFRQHLRRYMQIYLPDCPFEVSSTNRYTIVTHEARITARKFIKKGQPVKYLSGIQVLISPKEEDALSARKKDFSIVVSSRNKCASLFMGPARFANHDCGANARLMITSHGGIEIIATQNIEMGDEITVTYGESYFGEDNCECLCKTCEDNLVNGWAQPDGNAAALKKSIESAAGGYSLRRRRRDDSSASASRTPSVTPDIRPRIPKSRSKTAKMDSGRASLAGSPGPESLLRQKRKREFESLTTPPVTPAKKQKTMDCAMQATATPDGLFGRSSDEDSVNERSASESASVDMIITAATTPENDTQEPGLQSPEASPEKLQAPSLKQEDSVTSSLSELAPAPLLVEDQDSITAAPLPTIESPRKFAKMDDTTMTNGEESTVSVEPIALPAPATPLANAMGATLPTADVLPSPNGASDVSGTPDRGRTRTRGKTRETPQEDPPQEDSALKTASQRVRVPGDYTLTPVLLSEPDTAWVHCTICNEAFVQQDAYFTRSACPRCERHSKLYGYQWPKTEREGPRDKEERILDHRVVHRFLDPEDELKIRGRKLPRSSSLKPRPTATSTAAVGPTEAVVAVTTPTTTATTTTTTTTTAITITSTSQNVEASIHATIQAQPQMGIAETPAKRGRGRPRKHPRPSTTTTTTPTPNASAAKDDGDGDYLADRNCAAAAAAEAAEREDARRSARRRNPALRATVC